MVPLLRNRFIGVAAVAIPLCEEESVDLERDLMTLKGERKHTVWAERERVK